MTRINSFRFLNRTILIVLLVLMFGAQLAAQKTTNSPQYISVPLADLSFFKKANTHWALAESVTFGLKEASKKNIASGTGILLHSSNDKEADLLSTQDDFGNIAIEFDFMLSEGASATLYLQGRYGVRLTDSWTKDETASSICGTVITEAKGPNTLFTPARLNVCRAPGLWQHMQIMFKAPKFDAQKNKVRNATFARISLNGMILYENLELSGPSNHSALTGEVHKAPLTISSKHAIAFKDIRYVEAVDGDFTALIQPEKGRHIWERPITVAPTTKTLVQRCFIDYGGEKKTFCAAVGNPEGVHYAMDLSQGSMINFWKGGFIDATSMWTDRGEYQVARPLGAKIEIKPRPIFATLSQVAEAWPDSAGSNFSFKGYRLASDGNPTFMYKVSNAQIEDQVVMTDGQNKSLTRSLKVASGKVANNLYLLLAEATTITPLGHDMFVVGDHQYYIKLIGDKKIKPEIRKSAHGQELIMSGSVMDQGFSYMLIW